MENKGKKVLFVIDWYLPGYKAGGPIRSMANICEHLGEKLDIYIITRNTDYMDNIPYDKVLTNQWNTLSSNEQVFYTQDTLISKQFYAHIMKSMNFDAIYIHGIFSWKFSILPLIAANSIGHRRIILAPRGMLAPSALSIKKLRKSVFLFLARMCGLFRKVSFHATNAQEKKEIAKTISAKTETLVIDNLPRKIKKNFVVLKKERGELRLFSLSRIAREKNVLFAIQTLSGIGRSDLRTVYDIYGQIYDKQYWSECLELIGNLPPNIQVNYKGTVNPEKLDEVISSHHSLFMPTLGENYGHAILETMSSGRPVIISNKTQWRELSSSKAGWDIVLEQHDLFVEALTNLAEMGQEEFNKWCEGARMTSEKFINISELTSRYADMFGVDGGI